MCVCVENDCFIVVMMFPPCGRHIFHGRTNGKKEWWWWDGVRKAPSKGVQANA